MKRRKEFQLLKTDSATPTPAAASPPTRTITKAQLEQQIAALKQQREQLIGNINMCNGAIQAYEHMLASLLAPPPAAPADKPA